MQRIIHNVLTGEISEESLTAQEIEQLKNDQKQIEVKQAKREAEAQAQAAAKAALLERLGITEEEAKLLLG